jgi:thiol:disulfide interchange protein
MCGFAAEAPADFATGATAAPVQEKGNIGWGLLGCCIPLVGLILFLVWRNEKPADAKTAGIGALIGFGLGMLFSILSTVAGTIGAMGGF